MGAILTDSEMNPKKILNQYIYTNKKIDEGAFRSHRLEPTILSRLSKGRVFEDVYDDVEEFFGDDVVFVAHNVNFDLTRLMGQCAREGLEPLKYHRTFDTMIKYMPLLGSKKWIKLEELFNYVISKNYISRGNESIFFERLNAAIPIENKIRTIAHDALWDATIMYLCVLLIQKNEPNFTEV
jgi:DNA polymerase III epsilon subunit-like protein